MSEPVIRASCSRASFTSTGRLKDLIILRGRNHYPQDIEATWSSCSHQALRKDGGAAFSLTVEADNVWASSRKSSVKCGMICRSRKSSLRYRTNWLCVTKSARNVNTVVLPPGGVPRNFQRQAPAAAGVESLYRNGAYRKSLPCGRRRGAFDHKSAFQTKWFGPTILARIAQSSEIGSSAGSGNTKGWMS